MEGTLGLYLSDPSQKTLALSQENPLENVTEDMHVTLQEGEFAPVSHKMLDKEYLIKVTAYGCNGDVSSFKGSLPKDLRKLYDEDTAPSINVSTSKERKNRKVSFNPLKNVFFVSGKLGYYVPGDGVVTGETAKMYE